MYTPELDDGYLLKYVYIEITDLIRHGIVINDRCISNSIHNLHSIIIITYQGVDFFRKNNFSQLNIHHYKLLYIQALRELPALFFRNWEHFKQICI